MNLRDIELKPMIHFILSLLNLPTSIAIKILVELQNFLWNKLVLLTRIFFG